MIGVPNEVAASAYLEGKADNPLRAVIVAAGDGNLGAVMALSRQVTNINNSLEGIYKQWG